jgi:hypothetical protein
MRLILGPLAMVACLTTGCVSTKSSEVYATATVAGPRVVALSGARQPWTSEIEKRLRDRGFVVKRFTAVARVSEQTGPGRIETYSEASARVVLRVDGSAPNTSMTRCFGGGFKFDYISAEVIDTKDNETLATYSNSGYSEDCPPLSGTLFGDIVRMVEAVFK